MYGIKPRILVFITINVLINKVIGLQLNEDDLKKVVQAMQHKLLHGQHNTQDTRSRNDNNDLIDNARTLIDMNNLNQVTRTDVDGYKDNPMTILILKAKDKPKNSGGATIIENLLKDIVLNDKFKQKKYPANLQANYKTNEYSNEVKDLKKFSKLFLILNTSPNRNVINEEDLDDIGKLLSKWLSTKVSKDNENKKRYYKGFAIKDDESSSRRRRDSDESEAEDYRPKRLRSQNSGAVGGRTFAPSMGKKRHVYESE